MDHAYSAVLGTLDYHSTEISNQDYIALLEALQEEIEQRLALAKLVEARLVGQVTDDTPEG